MDVKSPNSPTDLAADDPDPKPPPRDLQGLLEFAEHEVADARLAREAASAIRTLGSWIDEPLDKISTDSSAVRRQFDGLSPGAAGVSMKRFTNVRYLVNKMRRLAGIQANNRPVAEALSLAWCTLMALITSRYWRTVLSPFARFCTMSNVEPDMVCDQVSENYLLHLTASSLVQSPRTTHQTACRVWNKAANGYGWPHVRLTVPSYTKTYTIDLSVFPASFQAEVKAYLASRGSTNLDALFDDSAPTRPVRPSTQRTMRYQLQQAASALVLTGMDIRAVRSLAILVEKLNFRRIVIFFYERERADMANMKTVAGIAQMLVGVARYWVKLDNPQLESLRMTTAKLTRKTVGLTEKNSERLQPFRQPETLARFLAFPERRLKEIYANGKLMELHAVESSLLIALLILIHAPVRVANLAALHLDTTLLLPASGKGETSISLPAASVKNGQAHGLVLPANVTTVLQTYIRLAKPLLRGSPSVYLFPSAPDRAKRSDTMSKQISKLIWKRLGLRYSPHLQRHITALMHADAHPGDHHTTASLLGHKSVETTRNHYGGMDANGASRLHARLILSNTDPLLLEVPAERQGPRRPAAPRHRMTKREA